MDPVLLSRIQFAVTVGFHFLFPPISIGLGWLLVIFEGLAWRRGDPDYERLAKFFGRLFALTFAVGVATGIVMEFQFGTNWANYSKFVGDIFGAPLAAEGVFAFFLESGFLGLYLFGRNRVSRGVHWFSALMVAFGATLSAFWIIVANSWQQTPAGFVVRNGRAELTSFSEAVFNPSTLIRYFHVVDAALITGAFFVAGISAYLLIRGIGGTLPRKSLKVALLFGLVASLLELAPFGHEHAKQVARTQPAKFAAIEGLYTSQSGAPLVLFGVPGSDPNPHLHAPVEIPKLLSWLAFGDFNHHIRGINEFAPEDRPPLWLTFVSFHNMVVLGMFFIAAMALGVFFLWRGVLWEKRWFLWLLVVAVPLPHMANQFGWVTAEVGRQPWIVYGLLRTAHAASPAVGAGDILFSLIVFSLIYLMLFSAYVYLGLRETHHAFADATETGAA